MIVLSEQELFELTDKERPSAQARELDAMGIPYRKRRNGSLAVLWIHVRTMKGESDAPTLPAEPQLVL